MFFDTIFQSKLEERKNNFLYRQLNIPSQLIDFSSNDYLSIAKEGLIANPISQHGGATGSRLISGNCEEAELAEIHIAKFHGFEAALIFNAGYSANTGLLSCIASKNDTYIIDANAHASIHDGVRLSLASKFNFKHNDLIDLEKKLLHAKGHKFVVAESIYSMDGDEAPLKDLVQLCIKHRAQLIIDEAHATGVYGANGEGLVHYYGLQKKVLATVYTFGKALGYHGAAVAGSAILKNYLINFSRPFIYSTAMPPHAYRQIVQAYLQLSLVNRKQLFDNIQYYKSKIKNLDTLIFTNSNSPIQGVILGDNKMALNLSKQLFEKGLFVKAILSPTVAKGTERLRICIHSHNTYQDIDLLLHEIKNYQL